MKAIVITEEQRDKFIRELELKFEETNSLTDDGFVSMSEHAGTAAWTAFCFLEEKGFIKVKNSYYK